MRLWGAALHLGRRHTEGLQALSRMLVHHGLGSKPCPLCDGSTLDPNPIGHLLREHCQELGLNDRIASTDLLTQCVVVTFSIFIS